MQSSLPQCGEYVATGWFGGSRAASDISTSDGALLQEVTLADDEKTVLAFRVGAESQDLRIELVTQGDGDPALEIYSAANGYLDENDDYGPSLSSRLDMTLAAGDYCAIISDLRTPATAVRAQVSRTEHTPLVEDYDRGSYGSYEDPVCTASTDALPFAQGPLDAALGGGRLEHVVRSPANQYLRFQLDAPTPLTLRATADGPDPKLVLFDANGTSIAENDDADGLNARLDFASPLAAGTYCVAMITVNGAQGDVTVSAEKLDRDTFIRNAWRRGEMAPVAGMDLPVEKLDLNATRPTMALLSSDAVWFEFEVDQESVLIINAYGKMAGVDTYLRLFDGTGLLLDENDDAVGTIDAQLTPRVYTPGNYYLALTQVGGGSAGGSARPVIISVERFLRLK